MARLPALPIELPLILHVITDLGAGGAERVLARLVMASSAFRHVIVTLMGDSVLSADLQSHGVDVISLGMRRGVFSPVALMRLTGIVRRLHPAAVQTWLYHADLLGLLAARLAGCRRVAWNLRCSNMDLTQYRWSTRTVVRLSAWLSSLPTLVLVNSVAAQQWHAALGYHPRRWEVIPNGIDTAVFRPDSASRSRWRQRLGVGDQTVLIGMVARHDPMKDHATMLAAAAQAARKTGNLSFVLAGNGVTRSDPQLAHWADAVGAAVHLIGPCEDVPALMAAFDVAVLSSAFGEGFPNVVAEAMATAVPCVVTDVGDSAVIVDKTGIVVPPRNPHALADAILTLAADASLRARLGEAARERIEQNYGLPAAVARYEALWQDLGHARK